MNGLADLGWAVLGILGAAAFLLILIADRPEIGRRLCQAGQLLAGAAALAYAVLHPWSLRGRTLPQMDPHHPSVKAASARGWSPLSDEEAWEFGIIADLIKAGEEAPEPEYKTRRGESS